MFKAPFSFEGRIRRIEYLLSAIIGGVVTGIAFWLGVGTAVFGAASNSGGDCCIGRWYLVHYCTRCKTSA